ncbi:hypothetical protein IKG16_03215 [Candidatus Saccharibacteria bacterium]|nr:hypothetical protein [Candidatus Saccharibacteria bacterium]
MIDRKKLIIPVSIAFGFVFIIIITSIILMQIFPKNDRTDADLTSPKYIALFENRYQLDYSIGEESSTKSLTNIGKIIISNEELSSATKPITPNEKENAYLTSTIEETSFKTIPNLNNDHAYDFNLNISDGRSYHIVIRTDQTFGDNYIATFIKNLSTTKSYLILYTTDLSIKNSILDWGISLDFNNPETIIN